MIRLAFGIVAVGLLSHLMYVLGRHAGFAAGFKAAKQRRDLMHKVYGPRADSASAQPNPVRADSGVPRLT